jgi:hypothetical protein
MPGLLNRIRPAAFPLKGVSVLNFTLPRHIPLYPPSPKKRLLRGRII